MNFQLMQSSFHLFVCLFFYQFAYKYAVHTVLCRSHNIFILDGIIIIIVFCWYCPCITYSTNYRWCCKWQIQQSPVHLTLKMTTAQIVETSVITTNSLSKGYPHPDDHALETNKYCCCWAIHNLFARSTLACVHTFATASDRYLFL